MRVVHVVRQFHPAIGGMESVVWELATAQLRNGHAVRVVTFDRKFGSRRSDPRLPARETLSGIEVFRIPFFGSTHYPIAPRLLRHVRDADIVHMHGVDSLFDYLAWTAPLHRKTLVVSTHGGFFHTPYAAKLKRLYFPTITRFSLSSYAGVATVSAADHQLFSSIRPRGAWLIENGVNIAKYADAAAPEPVKTIVSLGRFSTNKRLDRVIAFVAALRRRDPQWRLKLVGYPADQSAQDLIDLAEAFGVSEAIEIVASPTDHQIRTILGHCSVIASASDYEGFGLAVIEGMSAGLFPVLSGIPPFRRLVERGGHGMIVDFADPDAASGEFLRKWEEVAEDGAAYKAPAMDASAPYAWSHVSKQYDAFYESVLGNKVRSILDVSVGVSTVQEAIDLLDVSAQRGKAAMVVFANAHTLNHAISNERARAALRQSIVFNDGIGVDIASRVLFGKRFPENLNGTDFVPRYLQDTRHQFRIFLLGAAPGVADRAAEVLRQRAPRHTVVGISHGYLRPDETTELIARIRRSRADLLLVAMGDPKQELWLFDHLKDTGCRLGIGVGALFDFMAGAVPRAPQWMRAARLEWLYRMIQEPRRLWRRYLVGMPIFLLRVGRQWFTGARVSSATE